MNLLTDLTKLFGDVFASCAIPQPYAPMVTPSSKVEFADYQVNGTLAAAKALGVTPKQLAVKVLQNTPAHPLIGKLEVAGPGFINITLCSSWLSKRIEYAAGRSHRLLSFSELKQTVVVDYSSPNLAKEMHVGHLRGTIIGDALARVLEHKGNQVVRQNHIGDWGTQFGMLIAYLSKKVPQEQQLCELADLEVFYCKAKEAFDRDKSFALEARKTVERLQSGDPDCILRISC